MENNKFKNIWKNKVNEEIKPYSSRELDDMIVKSARKSIWKLFPGVWIKVVLSILVIGYFFQKMVSEDGGVPLLIFYIALTCVVSGSVILVLNGVHKMTQYNLNTPVKEWIKFRIDKVEKSIAFQRKYTAHIYIGIVGFVVGITVIYSYLLHGTVMLYSLIPGSVAGCLSACLIKRFLKIRYSKVYTSLKELYRQINEQETV